MGRIYKKAVLLVLLFAFCFSFIFPFDTRAASSRDFDERIAVLLVIDISGSMARTDPGYLRETASHILIDLLSADDYAGVITFNHDAQTIVPLQEVGGQGNKERIKNVISQEVDPGGYTDFAAAFSKVEEQFSGFAGGDMKEVTVFLTDGDPNPDPARRDEPGFLESYMEIVWGQTESFARENRPIYSVGFGEVEQPEIIQRISRETRGEAFLLDDPAELAVTFFDILGNLKNRTPLFRGNITPEEGKALFDFTVDEYSRQLNLLFLKEGSAGDILEINGPLGSDVNQIEGLSLTGEDNYILAVLQNLNQDYTGKWQAALRSTEEVEVFADIDTRLKSWLVHPMPNSEHPLNEEMDFKVKIDGFDDIIADRDVYVELKLRKPGASRDTYMELREEEGFFVGSADGFNTPGECLINVRVFVEGTLVNETSHTVFVKAIPSILADFQIQEIYPLGEEFLAAASLHIRGRRLFHGRGLEVNSFQLIMQEAQGERLTFELNDEGFDGDIRAGDGIWSILVNLEKEGEFDTYLFVRGSYGGDDFMLQKDLGRTEVAPPGKIAVSLESDDIWGSSGRNMKIPVLIESNSSFERELFAVNSGSDGGSGFLLEEKIILEPGEHKETDLNVKIPPGTEKGTHTLFLEFYADDEGVLVEPASYELDFSVLSGIPAFLRYLQDFYNDWTETVWAVFLFSLLALTIFKRGSNLYRKKVLPFKNVGGKIKYYPADGIEKINSELIKEIDLDKVNKNKIVISLGENNEDAEFVLQEREGSFDIILEIQEGRKSSFSFIEGFRSRKEDYIPSQIRIRCTPPGIMEFGEKDIHTNKMLFHGDIFKSGGHLFKYVNNKREEIDDILRGENILKDSLE